MLGDFPPAAVQFPVSYTEFQVPGLDLHNDAAPDASTTIGVTVVRDDAVNYRPPPHYGWREVKVQASFNGGTTWHTVLATRRGSHWTVTVHDPGAGFVSLRSIAVNVKGDSTVQTIYRAYGIS